MLSLEDKVFVIQKYHETRSFSAVRREFRHRDARLNGQNLPSLRQLRRVVKCFEESGSVLDRRKKNQVEEWWYFGLYPAGFSYSKTLLE